MIASCFNCLWIFDTEDDEEATCPKCECAQLDGARSIYGAGVYNRRKTQQPWFDRAIRAYTHELRKQIKESQG